MRAGGGLCHSPCRGTAGKFADGGARPGMSSRAAASYGQMGLALTSFFFFSLKISFNPFRGNLRTVETVECRSAWVYGLPPPLARDAMCAQFAEWYCGRAQHDAQRQDVQVMIEGPGHCADA